MFVACLTPVLVLMAAASPAPTGSLAVSLLGSDTPCLSLSDKPLGLSGESGSGGQCQAVALCVGEASEL